MAKWETDARALIAFSPDGRKMMAANLESHTAFIWDAETGKELQTLAGHTERISTAVFSPDGKKALTASDDKTARIWDAESGRELWKEEGIYRLALSPDGKKIAIGFSRGDGDYTVRIWNSSAIAKE